MEGRLKKAARSGEPRRKIFDLLVEKRRIKIASRREKVQLRRSSCHKVDLTLGRAQHIFYGGWRSDRSIGVGAPNIPENFTTPRQ